MIFHLSVAILSMLWIIVTLLNLMATLFCLIHWLQLSVSLHFRWQENHSERVIFQYKFNITTITLPFTTNNGTMARWHANKSNRFCAIIWHFTMCPFKITNWTVSVRSVYSKWMNIGGVWVEFSYHDNGLKTMV